MNPFETNKIFNSEIYDCVNKINKNSDKNVIQGLSKLVDIEDDSIKFDNILLRDGLKKHLISSNITIKHLSSDLLLKMLKTDNNNININEILSIWLIKFIEDHTYQIDQLIYKKYINLKDIKDNLLDILDWKNDLLNSLKCFNFLLKHVQMENNEAYIKYFNEKIIYLKFNSNIILKNLYIIIETLGSFNEIYDSIVNIKAPTLINLKWKIIFKLYNKIPECLNKDAKYIDSDFLQKIIENYEGNLEDIEIRNIDSFYTILKKINNKIDYFIKYYKYLSLEDFCIYKITPSIKEFEKKLDFNIVNQLIKVTILKHKINQDDLHSCCNLSKEYIYEDLVSSLENLNSNEKIIRADLLNLKLEKDNFKFEDIMNCLTHSVNVFEKDVFVNEKLDNYDILPLICKYPEIYSLVDINKYLKLSNIEEISKIPKFRKEVFKFLKKTEIREIYKNYKFPKEFDIFFFYNFKDLEVRYIDYQDLTENYLFGDFLNQCFNLEIFNIDLFNNSIIKILSEIDIPVNTEYNDTYYDSIPHFYKNILIRKDIHKIREIKNIYINRIMSDINRLILSICNTILNEGDVLSLSDKLILNLNKNNFYLYKVYHDLGWSIKEPFERNLETYNLVDNKNLKKIDLNIIRGYEPENINISYLSNKSLKIYIKYILLEEDIFKYLDLIENDKILEDSYLKLERYKIYEPLLDKIYIFFSNTFINNFSLSQMEEDIDEKELYQFVISGIPTREDLFWKILPNVLMRIRNINLLFFIEKIIKKYKNFKEIYENVNKETKEILAFLFPSLYDKFIQKNINLDKFIIKEAEYLISGVECKYTLRSNCIQINLKYILEGNDFDSVIKVPYEYPLKKPEFTTNVEKKSLLNLKISELLRRTSKFMEVINLWKINIDQKSLGVQECYICYFILHLLDGSFPKYICIHCNNKFHNKCIDKWRIGYKNNNCPLCRKPLPIY